MGWRALVPWLKTLRPMTYMGRNRRQDRLVEQILIVESFK